MNTGHLICDNLWRTYQDVLFLCRVMPRLDTHFAIITAHNPRGVAQSNALNIRLNQQLIARLQAEGLAYQAMDGASMDLRYQEPGFAIYCDLPQAIGLATEYQQNAFYWVKQGQLWLMPCLVTLRQALALGPIDPRIRLMPAAQ